MAEMDLVGTGGPVPRIKGVEAMDGRKLRVDWQSGGGHIVDVRPALLSHRSFVRLRTDNTLFQTARMDEFGDAVVWDNGSALPAAWLYNLAEPDLLSNDEFRLAMESLRMSLDGMAVRLGVARRLIAEYRKDKPIPRTVSLATRYLLDRQNRTSSV